MSAELISTLFHEDMLCLDVFKRLEVALSRSKVSSICFKPQQVQCFEYLLKGLDVVAVLPTGFGKSLVFQLLPYFLPTKSQRNIVIVICPLFSIIEDQIKVLKSMGITAGVLHYFICS